MGVLSGLELYLHCKQTQNPPLSRNTKWLTLALGLQSDRKQSSESASNLNRNMSSYSIQLADVVTVQQEMSAILGKLKVRNLMSG